MNNKLLGLLSIALGALGFVPFFGRGLNGLILTESNIFIVKYFIVILLVNGGLFFALVGILLFHGKFLPANKYEKARNNLISLIFTSPFFASMVVTIITQSQTTFWTIVGWVTLSYLLFQVLNDLKTLKERS